MVKNAEEFSSMRLEILDEMLEFEYAVINKAVSNAVRNHLEWKAAVYLGRRLSMAEQIHLLYVLKKAKYHDVFVNSVQITQDNTSELTWDTEVKLNWYVGEGQ